MRDAPSVDIVAGLQKAGASVRAFDPVAMPAAGLVLRDVEFCADAYEACRGAHAVVIVTEWNQFRMLEFERMRGLLAEPVLVDLRNVYEPEAMAKAGFEYTSVGR
jgi:UDPglucose 6-dehydrogenase